VGAQLSEAEDDEADEYDNQHEERQGPDRALERCEALSVKLARSLGNPSTSGDCFDQTELDNRHQVVTAGDVWKACGGVEGTPRLKPYQVVGVNFLSLLHEQVTMSRLSEGVWGCGGQAHHDLRGALKTAAVPA
jgi:hypothetical protein